MLKKERIGGMGRMVMGLAVAVAWLTAGLPAEAREWKIYESEKYGYSLKIPAEFNLDTEDKTTNWSYQPGSAATADDGKKSKKKKKKRSFGINVRGVGFRTEKSEEESASGAGGGSSGGLEPALGIYVNWVWMPDVDSGMMFSTNKKSDAQNMESPDPDYHDLIVFDEDEGYAYEGNTYWYKEVDKDEGDEIHRWHIKSYGNKSAYTVGLTGTYAQFEEWAPVFEEVVKSWKLIPMEE